MTPLLILTHGEFGRVLLGSAESMFGRQEGVLALGLAPDETRESFAARVAEAGAALGAPALVLVDLAGGTPWNVALACGCAGAGGEVMAGLSLPVLLEALGRRDGPDREPPALAAALAGLAAATFMRASVLLSREGERA